MVDAVEMHTRQEFRDGVLCSLKPVAWEESTPVIAPLKQCMCGLAVGLNSSHSDLAALILQRLWVRHGLCAVAHCRVEDGIDGVDFECNILDTVAVLLQVVVNFSQLLLFLGGETVDLVEGAQRRSEDEGDVSVANDVGADISVTGFKTTVGDALEAHACDVVRSGLFGVTYIPVHMVVASVAGEGVSVCGRGAGGDRGHGCCFFCLCYACTLVLLSIVIQVL